MRNKQSEIPFRFRRIAAHHLESIRFSEIGTNTTDLYLGDDVCPIYRPDLEKPAYYEFQVLKSTREKVDGREDVLEDVRKINVFGDKGFKATYITPGFSTDPKKAGEVPSASNVQGFIMVSTADHDFPIPHWSLERIPPSVFLETESKSSKKKIAKVYRVDSMAYLAEDSTGAEVAHLGLMPALINGLPADLKKFEGEISSSVTPRKSGDARQVDDSQIEKPGRVITKGPKPPELTFKMPAWKELKKAFKASFRPLLDMVKTNASEVWKTQMLIEEFGEGIIAGQVFNLVPLEKEYEVEISGEAVEFVKLRIVKRPQGFSVVELMTSQLPFNRESNLTVVFNYGKKSQEKVELFIVNRNSPSESRNNLKSE